MLLVNGVESSHADLDDPEWLEFEYLRWTAAVIEDTFPPGSAPAVLHLGAAGCSLARHLLVTRPGSRHLAVDIDARLAALVRDWFELPRAPLLRIRIGDARAVLESLPDNSRDVVVRDVFAGDTTPADLLTDGFVAQVRRVLRPGGLYLLNCADRPSLELTRREVATLATAFGTVALTADPPMLKGRRRGNVVVVGSDVPVGGPALTRQLLAGAVPAHWWPPDEVATFARRAEPWRDPVVVDPEGD
ncbi:methyltransferase domain-containing protein [Nakamurella sp. YIM 132087]|uniref:Methyltransferase domain-containing protein n=2 Tax=Nakamurella alba TaxID=2665158 RepID=A0A7K1FG15_9ACTN|nr:methyltransferase domain-containing protein [Nakamurella alba]